jgi:acetyl esterase
MGQEPHPDVQAVLNELDSLGTPDFADLSVDSARALHDELMASEKADRDPVDRIRDLEVAGPHGPIPIRVYEPDVSGSRPVFVYFHGGGWVFPTTGGHDQTARAIANAGDCTVVSVDYRLAPEHPFPVPFEDCYAALEWVATHPGVLDDDTDRLAVGGDSAGGNLAAAACLYARDNDGPSIAHQFLVYPVMNHSFGTASYEENAAGYLLTQAGMRWFWDHYLDSLTAGKNPYASPLQARDVSGLPPATVVTAGFDPLRDEGAAYADRLAEAGVAVDHRLHEDMIHGFVPMLIEPELDAARNEIAQFGETIRGL